MKIMARVLHAVSVAAFAVWSAALAGAAFTPDLYACAAAWAPVTDMRRFLESRAEDYGRNSAPYSSWLHTIGGNGADLDAASPARQAARIECPVLLMHGAADSTVRIDQSEVMSAALLRAGKRVEFIRFQNENHYIEKAATRIRFLAELQRFLKANIGG
jgi:dipeptidyl aminopeptidase/acylaminoacyl peptidase